MTQQDYKHITLLRLSSIGDTLMLLPAIRLLRRHYPAADINWIIDENIAPLFALLPELTLFPITKPRSLTNYWDFKKQWQHYNTDLLVSFQTSLRSNIMTALLPTTYKAGMGFPYAREGHTMVVNAAHRLPSECHQVLIFYMLAQKIAGLPISPHLNLKDLLLPVEESAQHWATQQLAGAQKWLAINPMASSKEKTWSGQSTAELIKQIRQRFPDYHIVLTGGKGEQEKQFANDIAVQSGEPCLNLVGKTSLMQLAAVLQHVQCLIAPDTGPLHLANAVGTKVIGLYAVTRPDYIGPYGQLEQCIDHYSETAQAYYPNKKKGVTWQKTIPSLDAIHTITVDEVLAKLSLCLNDDGDSTQLLSSFLAEP